MLRGKLSSYRKWWNSSLTFWHRSFTFISNKSPAWCNSFSVYYPDVCLQLNMFRAFSRPSSGAQLLQWQPLVLPSYRGDSRAVFVVGPVILITVTFASAERLVSVGPSSLIFISEDSVLLSYDVLSLGYWFPTFRRTSAFFLKSKVNPHQLPYPSKWKNVHN